MSTAELESPTDTKELSLQDKLDQFVAETDQAIEQISREYLPLAVTDFGDKEMITTIADAHKKVRAMRVKVDKTRKALKADALAWGRTVEEQAKRLTAALKPIEDHLKGERDKVDAEKARIKEEKERAAQAALQARIDALTAVNGDVSDLLKLQVMPEEAFQKFLKLATEANEKAIAEEEAREAAVLVQAELLRYDKTHTVEEILSWTEVERRSMLAAAKKMFDEAEAARVEAERLRAEKEEADRKEREELEEKNRQQQEELAQLRREKEEREAAERARIEAEEAAKREAEEAEQRRLQEEADAKAAAEAEAKRKEREEALRPERERLEAFAESLRNFAIPQSLANHVEELQGILNAAAIAVDVIADELE